MKTIQCKFNIFIIHIEGEVVSIVTILYKICLGNLINNPFF